jgi:hypothetical protein
MKQTSTVKLKVVFTCSDLKSSAEDAVELLSQLQGLLQKFKPNSKMETKELSLNNSNPIPQLSAQLKKLQKVQGKSSRSRKQLD